MVTDSRHFMSTTITAELQALFYVGLTVPYKGYNWLLILGDYHQESRHHAAA